MLGISKGSAQMLSFDANPVAGTKLRGSTVSRSDRWTAAPAVKEFIHGKQAAALAAQTKALRRHSREDVPRS